MRGEVKGAGGPHGDVSSPRTPSLWQQGATEGGAAVQNLGLSGMGNGVGETAVSTER